MTNTETYEHPEICTCGEWADDHASHGEGYCLTCVCPQFEGGALVWADCDELVQS